MSSRENPIVILDDDDDDLIVVSGTTSATNATSASSTSTRIVYHNHHHHHEEDDDDEDEFDYYDDEEINNIMMVEDDEDEDDEDDFFGFNYHHGHGNNNNNNSRMMRMMISNPVRMEKYKQRMEAAKAFLQRATETTNILHAEKIINEACELLENWTNDYEEEILQGDDDDRDGDHRRGHGHHGHNHNPNEENPFATFLAQARHRLGQIALLKGDLSKASSLFLHVIVHDSHTLSPSALAMTWYDVAVIFLTYGNLLQGEEALKHAYSSLMNQDTQNVTRDETLFVFIQQAMIRLIDTVATQARTGNIMNTIIPPTITGLPFSSQFTVVTYNFDNSNNNNGNNGNNGDAASNNGNGMATSGGGANGQVGSTIPNSSKVGGASNIQEESRRLLDPSIWAAGAA